LLLKGDVVPEILDPVTRQHVERAAEALQREFEGVFSQETIARYIAESTDLLGEARSTSSSLSSPTASPVSA
jgi:hypothetical protein